MKTTILSMLALLTLNLANAQWWGSEKIKGNGELTEKELQTEPYDEISVAGNFEVKLVEGTEGKITLEAEANLIPHIEIKVKQGGLEIGPEEGYDLRPSKGNKIYVVVPVQDIEEISLAGSGSVYSDTVLRNDKLECNLAGSGSMKLKAETKRMVTNIAGSGDISLEGKSEWLECNIAGSGDLEGFNMEAGDVNANIAGSGDVMITCNGELTASIVGSGDVVYMGNPTKETSNSLGSGDIRKKGK